MVTQAQAVPRASVDPTVASIAGGLRVEVIKRVVTVARYRCSAERCVIHRASPWARHAAEALRREERESVMRTHAPAKMPEPAVAEGVTRWELEV